MEGERTWGLLGGICATSWPGTCTSQKNCTTRSLHFVVEATGEDGTVVPGGSKGSYATCSEYAT